MKKLKLFFALFAMLALNVGNVWAQETHTIGWGSATGTNFTNFTATDGSGEVANVVSVTTAKNSASSAPAYNASSKELRLYYNAQGNGCSLTLTPAKGITITGVKITASSTSYTPTVKYNVDGGSDASGTWSSTTMTIGGINATTSFKLRNANAANKQLRIKTIQITYTKEVATGPTLSATPNKVDFGTKNIYLESEKEGDLEIDITGQNLTGDVTAAISGVDASVFTLSKTTFTPNSGEVSEKLSVSYSVSEVKNYTATLTLSSDGVDAIELPITLKTVSKKPTIYTKVTDAATLSAGDKVIFVYEVGKKAAGKLSSGYLASIDIAQAINTTANPAIVSITDEAVIEYTLGGTTGAWELISASGKLSEASANSSSSVDLALDKGTKWTISISSGNATIKGTTNTIKYNTSSPRFKTYSSGQTAIQLYAISVPKYAVNFTQPEGGELSVKNGETAITSGNTFAEGIKLTVTATPANGYEGGTVVVKDADDNDVTATVYADGVLTMPAYAVTISATFEKKPCELLAKPTVSAETTYNSATLSWGAVTNAAKYSVKVGETTTEVTEPTYTATGLNAETTYTYQVQAIAEAEQDMYCDSEVAEGSFTTTAAPVATLTLSDIEGTTTKTGALNSTITLPTTAAECSKTFVGWDSKSDCAVAPEYAPGAEYTLAAENQTLYAVYADGESGEADVIFSETFDACNGKGGNDTEGWSGDIASATLNVTGWSCASGSAANGCAKFGTGSKQGSAETPAISLTGAATLTFRAAAWNGNSEGTTLNISAIGATLDMSSVTLKKAEWTEYTIVITDATGSVKIKFEAKNASNNRFFLDDVVVSQASVAYSNYSTACAAAPKAEVNPTAVSATAAGANDKVEVTYENVNTENVAVALFNDEACTEAFSADWLTASLDGDKNITYTVAATTLYTERKAYIKLTAPETTGATEPAVVVIPVTQAGKDKVFASLEELVAAITPTKEGVEVTVTLTNEVIQDFYTSSSYRNGIALNVPYEDGVKVIEIYCKDVPAEWVKGGKVSGTITCPWKLYNSTWELCPTAWTELTYTAPATVKSIAVSGTPTKTTYVDGEAFDPTGLVVTATLTDDSTEPIDVALVDWTFDPETLSMGETSVSVVATYNTMASAAYEVTGLTVNDIPTKTVAEFITAGGTRCYLEGIVSNITNTTYGNFDLTDASGKIYVYGCLNAAGESQKFADLGVKEGDKIKVIADVYELYQGTKQEAKNVQYVSHISAATITIADITMEVGETKTIAATITPAAAETAVTYTIKENTANAISLSGNVITANSVGTATITATVAKGATYMGNSVDFTVTVNPKSEKTNVVILAEYNDTWYALVAAKGSANNTLGAVEVTYVNGVILDFDGDKASITWERAIVGNKATFKNGTNYMKGATGDTDLTLETSAFEWDVVDGKYLSDANKRTFLFQGSYFKNYAISNAGKTTNGTTYSAMPIVIEPEFATTSVLRDNLYDGKWGTLCPDQKVTDMQGASFYTLTYLEMKDGMPYKLFFDEITTNYLEAGKPYLFIAEGEKIKGVKSGEVVNDPSNYNGFCGNVSGNTISLATTQTEYVADGDVVNYYGVINSRFTLLGDGTTVAHERAYVQIKNGQLDCPNPPASLPALASGARRVVAGATGINTATGVDQVQGDNVPTKMIINGQLFILRGEKMYDAQGKLVK